MMQPQSFLRVFAQRLARFTGWPATTNAPVPTTGAARLTDRPATPVLPDAGRHADSADDASTPTDAAVWTNSDSLREHLMSALVRGHDREVRMFLAQIAQSPDRRTASTPHADAMRVVLSNLSTLAFRDELTGLQNRRGFMCLGAQILAIAARTWRSSTLIYADVDGLKHVNDSAGHVAGDDLLVRASQVLKATFRETDVLARLSGDEFVALTAADGIMSAQTVAVRLRRAILHANKSRPKFPVSLSIGIATFDPAAPVSLEALVSKADGSMYLQKRARFTRPSPALASVNDASAGVRA